MDEGAQLDLFGGEAAPVPVYSGIPPSEVERPAGCFLDHTFRKECAFIPKRLVPQCDRCEHFDEDWAVLDAALRRVPKRKPGKKPKRKGPKMPKRRVK